MDVTFPIGQLEIPYEANLEDLQVWLGEISSYSERLRKTVEDLDHASLEKTYREGSWNVRVLVHHIADSQVNMYQRLRMALTDDNPVLPPFDQDRWAVLADNNLPVESSLQLLDGLNKRIVALGKELKEEDLKRTFTLAGSGEITVATKLKKLYWHEEHHLAHIHLALGNKL